MFIYFCSFLFARKCDQFELVQILIISLCHLSVKLLVSWGNVQRIRNKLYKIILGSYLLLTRYLILLFPKAFYFCLIHTYYLGILQITVIKYGQYLRLVNLYLHINDFPFYSRARLGYSLRIDRIVR